MNNNYHPIQYSPIIFSDETIQHRASEFYQFMNKRRSIRDFSSKKIPDGVIENILLTANTAPSGANKQPWTFCIVSDQEIKRKIRLAAEEEEYKAYHGGMPEDWLEDLSYLGTDWQKEFLDIAPILIIVFRKSYDSVNGIKKKNYYVQESVGLACGFLLAAIHNAGLVALTHTPSPMNFLSEILGRPDNEKPFLLIPVGYPSETANVPDIQRKKLNEFVIRY